MEATDLIAEAKELLAKAEETIKNLEHAEAGQLRIVVARLRVFVEQHAGHASAPVEPETAEPADEDEDLESLTRDELNERAEAAGVQDADKLPNKGAVIDAIRAAEPADEE
jgi:hypothetical protein